MCADKARLHAWLKQLAIPIAMRYSNQFARFPSCDDRRDALFYGLERKPVAPRCQRIPILLIGFIFVGTPVSLPDALDQFRRHTVAFNRERVVRVILVDSIDEA